MQTFYTILSIAPNPSSHDVISIGLLSSYDNKFVIRFSDLKKSIARRLLGSSSDLVDFLVKQLSTSIEKENERLRYQKNSIFPLDTLLNSEYFSYLHHYSNGILQFSKPNLLRDTLSDEKFSKLFTLFIDKNHDPAHERFAQTYREFDFIVQEKLINRVYSKVHTNVTIDSRILPAMFFSYEMDCLGKNGQIIGAKSIPLDKTFDTLDKSVNHFMSLISLIAQTYRSAENKFFLITQEPVGSKDIIELYDRLRKNPLFKVIHPEEASLVATQVEESKATKFLKEVA